MNPNIFGPLYGLALVVAGGFIGWRVGREAGLSAAVTSFGGVVVGAFLTAITEQSESLDWMGIGLVAFSLSAAWGVFARWFYIVSVSVRRPAVRIANKSRRFRHIRVLARL